MLRAVERSDDPCFALECLAGRVMLCRLHFPPPAGRISTGGALAVRPLVHPPVRLWRNVFDVE